MTHKDKRIAKAIDTPYRRAAITDFVYGNCPVTDEERQILSDDRAYLSGESGYKLYIGEMHGHTNLSDGQPDIDTYFRVLRKRVDFAAVTDHDHGGVGKPCLWYGSPSKWDLIKQKVREYYEPGRFTTLLAYERDSYPLYGNAVLYYASHDGEMVRGIRDGEMTREEALDLLARDDIIFAPHDMYELSCGTDFSAMPAELMPRYCEIYSRGDASEYMGNPGFSAGTACRGGFWQDALKRGIKMNVWSGSDDHAMMNAAVTDDSAPYCYPGLTGVWAEDNTVEAIFSALKAGRCYGFMGGRIEIDFRINGHWMGETFSAGEQEDLKIWFSVRADARVKTVTVLKNCEDLAVFNGRQECVFLDRRREKANDLYYLRAELADGRFGWTSPVEVLNSGI